MSLNPSSNFSCGNVMGVAPALPGGNSPVTTCDLGFGVWGLGFKVYSLESGALGLWGLGIRALGFEFGVRDLGLRSWGWGWDYGLG